ncbi:MAG: choice-of-anchor N protein [Limisphaerales bacterium]
MKNLLLTAACLGAMAACQVANALPSLQLGITGGTYVGGTEQSTVANADQFTLNAYLDGAFDGGTYYLSAALVPRQTQTTPPPSLGSFTINGATILVTGDMTYGVPPLESNVAFDNGDLGQHGIFETYFFELPFQFTQSQTTSKFNVADPLEKPTGTMYYVPFQIDVSALPVGYGIHFDLYDTVAKNGDIDLLNGKGAFAPFSHDAASRINTVPDGGTTAALLGLGMLSIGFMARRKA